VFPVKIRGGFSSFCLQNLIPVTSPSFNKTKIPLRKNYMEGRKGPLSSLRRYPTVTLGQDKFSE